MLHHKSKKIIGYTQYSEKFIYSLSLYNIKMSSFEVHIEKYNLFKKDAENETVSHPSRIEAYFAAAYQLIEACMAKYGLHINKHQMVRTILSQEERVFNSDTETVWRRFQLLENQIRPGQSYGGKINGEELKRAEQVFEEIKKICEKALKDDSKGV